VNNLTMWNTKSCKCKVCNEEFDSINGGKAHVVVKHGIKHSNARLELVLIEQLGAA